MADCASSAATPRASCGKFDDNSHTLDLIAFPIEQYNGAADAMSADLRDAMTLLKVCFDICAEASDPRGFWVRPSGWAEAKFEHLHNVLGIVWEKLNDVDQSARTGDAVVSQCVDARRAA